MKLIIAVGTGIGFWFFLLDFFIDFAAPTRFQDLVGLLICFGFQLWVEKDDEE